MAKKPVGTGMGVGSSSILVIFILLCLTTFATLSLMSANADLKLTEKSAAATQAFYRADGQATELLAKIDRALPELPSQGQLTPEFYRHAAQQVEQAVPQVSAQGTGNFLLLQYQVPLDENQTLFVDLQAYSGGQRYKIQRWSVAYTGEWQPESEGFQLWDGEEGFALAGDGGLPF